MLGIKWAPLSIPLPRRIQTLCVTLWFAALPIAVFLTIWLALSPLLYVFYIPYLIWMWRDKAPVEGGRLIPALKDMGFWKHYCSYFPGEIILQEELDPNKTYILAAHPHGIIGMAVWVNFITSCGNAYARVLKNLKYRVLTLPLNFKIPFWRDYLLGLGMASVSKESCEHCLKNGISIMIVIGGAEESLDAHPHSNKIIVKKRKGFIKLALKHGVSLVPVFSFGENETYDQVANPPGSLLRKFQNLFQHNIGVGAPIFSGRGIFTYNWGVLPKRQKLTTIIGKPIPVVKTPNFTSQDVENLQQTYIKNLINLYNKYKDEYGNGVELEIVH